MTPEHQTEAIEHAVNEFLIAVTPFAALFAGALVILSGVRIIMILSERD